jgi:O-antigen/teichoic acid export membrane protein
MKSVSRTVFRNSAFSVAAQFSIKLLSFVFTVLVVRQLGPETYGQYMGVLAFGAVFQIFSDLGLSPYVVREVARLRDQPDGFAKAQALYGNALALRLLLAVLTALATTGLAWLTGQPLLMVGAIGLHSLSLVLYGVQGASEAALMGFERLDLISGARVLNQLIFVVLGSLALWWGIGFFGLIIGNLVGVSVYTIVCWRAVRRFYLFPHQPNWQAWLPLLRASWPFALIGLALGFSYRYDSLLLSYRSAEENGLYNSVYNLVFSAVLLSNSFCVALYPTLTRRAVTHPETLPGIYARAFRYLMLMSLPIAAGAWALADQIVPFLFGDEYLSATPALKILIWVLPFMFASEFLGYIVVIAGQENKVARSLLLSTSVNVTLNTLLVPQYGYLVAAVMTVMTEVILVGQYIWLLRATLRQMDLHNILTRPLLAIGIMALVLWLLPTVSFLALIPLGAVVYATVLVGLGVLGRDELRFFRELRQDGGAVDVATSK